MKELDRITLIIADTRSYAQAVHSLKKTLAQIKPARTIFFTDVEIPHLPEGVEWIKINPLSSKEEYSAFIIKNLAFYIDTQFVMIVQWDSWVLDSEQWTDEFLENDYIGSSWIEKDGYAVGNGGFSIRSKRLMDAVSKDPIIKAVHPEDNVLCRIYRPYLEAHYGFTWAPEELADKFGYELKTPANPTFGFHGPFHEPYHETIMISRRGAGGDIVALEPLLHYYFKKGYRVVLNTEPNFFNFFRQHYFKIHHPDEVDRRLSYTELDLNFGYEIFPKQLHLKTYYEMAGITDGEIRNPKLNLSFDPKQKENKLFKKYAVIHNDVRLQESRNIHNVNWGKVVAYLNSYGYDAIQIGQAEHEEIPWAIHMNCPTELMLMWTVGGADLFIGIDSGPSNIAVAMNTPAIICFGSVNPDHIIPDQTNVIAIHNHGKHVCEKAFCWSDSIGQTGTPCYIDDKQPPCVDFHESQIIEAIDKMINK